MRKLVQNGTMSRMIRRDLRLPARVAMKYAMGKAANRQRIVPTVARMSEVTNGVDRSNACP